MRLWNQAELSGYQLFIDRWGLNPSQLKIPEVLGIVISQDANVRFIKRRHGQVTYWEQAISFALKISMNR